VGDSKFAPPGILFFFKKRAPFFAPRPGGQQFLFNGNWGGGKLRGFFLFFCAGENPGLDFWGWEKNKKIHSENFFAGENFGILMGKFFFSF